MFQSPLFRPVVNKSLPSERLVRLLSFLLCALAYVCGLVLVFQCLENRTEPPVTSVRAVKMSFAQIELQAEPQPVPEPEPEKVPEPEVMPEPEEADVALEEVPDEPPPEPEPRPEPEVVEEVARVSQEAAAPVAAVESEVLLGWILEQIEREKYYPPAAERFGITGTFELKVTVGADGTIRSAEVLPGRGHRVLRQALEQMMNRITGRRYGYPPGKQMEFPVQFEFE